MNAILKTILGLAALAAVAGCDPNNPENLKAEFRAASGGPVDKATLKVAYRLCSERYAGLMQTERAVYGPYSDWTGLIDDAKACMLRHGVRVMGWRQKDGRLTTYPISPKWLES